MSEAEYALVADIGGTNARFALVDQVNSSPQHERTLRCADFPGPVEAVRHYLAPLGGPRLRVAAFDVATPVTGDFVALTNGPWSFSVATVRDALGLERLHVINDFTALALAVPLLDREEIRQIGGGVAKPNTAIAVLGAGTGLGASGLIWDGRRWLPLAGEGGHVSFSPATEREDAILRVLRRRFGTHVSAERWLSGMGLTNIYSALAELDEGRPHALEPDQITQRAQQGHDQRSLETVAIFCAALGTIAGDLALTLGARSGVYVGGGIVPKLGALFDRSAFRQRFEDKGRYRGYLSEIPTWVIVAEAPALRGLASLLSQEVRGATARD